VEVFLMVTLGRTGLLRSKFEPTSPSGNVRGGKGHNEQMNFASCTFAV